MGNFGYWDLRGYSAVGRLWKLLPDSSKGTPENAEFCGRKVLLSSTQKMERRKKKDKGNCLDSGSSNLFCKGQVINILVLVAHTGTVEMTPLCFAA